ncbi:helix-turn-helix transcriptional regulator [Kutzneria buriramensis]|uniref:Helix-turn-helix protein n=1 Tax=Kutzneria buriramensis TaxID=1045776 RepID=A0A3E0H0T7_9PSEU|nr:winged helix-turn-helix domain-containing protein [Kutzneria buriramensis]REH35173.1 helix-turn-helix protein [Kutzneria buriramensis]
MSTLRLRFTAQDLLRTKVLTAPDPMWELVLSVHRLQPGGELDRHTAWRRAVRPRLSGADSVRACRLLRTLVPPAGNFPDFLTPLPTSDGVDGAIEAIRATPRDRLALDLSPARLRRVDDSRFCHGLATGRDAPMSELVGALRHYYDAAVAPHWGEIADHVRSDGDTRAHELVDDGLGGMFARLGPGFRWRWPYLETDYPRSHEIRLGGRGLTLVPSYFCTGTPVTLIDEELPPMLVFPARRLPRDPSEEDRAPFHLAKVIGRTRARILIALRTPRSTSDLAEAIGMSLASASQQVTLLRNADFVVSRRDGQAVRHSVTRKGKALLEIRTNESRRPYDYA